MAQMNYGFYVKDPSITPDQLMASLKAKYPNFKAYFRSELINIGAKNKGGVYIQLDKSLVTGVKISLDTDNVVTVLPNMGSGCLGFILGFLEFAFSDFRLASEVGGYLKENFGETDLLVCARCNKIYPHYVEKCLKCGNELIPYKNPTGETPLLTPDQIGRTPSNVNAPSSTENSSSPLNENSFNNTPLVASNYNQPKKNRNSAILLEIIPGLFGLYGFGWIYSGKNTVGISLLVGGIIWWCISIVAATYTGTMSCFCTLPMNVIVLILSTFMLYNYANKHTEIFG